MPPWSEQPDYFRYTAGWLSPQRLTPEKIAAVLAPPGGPAPGHRRNHAKVTCFTGTFEANGNGSSLSKAQVFARGQYPVVGRFNLATADPNTADAMVCARHRRPIPPRMGRNGAAQHAAWTGSYAEERYNSLNSFLFVDANGIRHTIRWSLVPAAQPVPISPEELAKRGPDFLEQEAFFAVILMHVAAILFHKLVRNDGVFETMAPGVTSDRRK